MGAAFSASPEQLKQEIDATSKESAKLKEQVAHLEKAAARQPTEFDKYLHPEPSYGGERLARATVTQHIITSTRGDHGLTMLMNAIQHACKVTSNEIAKAGTSGTYGLAGEVNSTGDDVKKLDIISNNIWCECLIRSGVCSLLVSEENEEAIPVPQELAQGPFCVAFDPLDGSSNIDCNVSVGSIFAVYKRSSALGTPATPKDIMKPGTEIVAAGYCMYGAATELVVTYQGIPGVQRFALDPAFGEFVFVADMVMDPKGGKKIFSCNEGNSLQWDQPILDYVEACKDSGYAARYVGSMVSDVHRTLLYGGIFIYPADKKSVKGKLRVLYEGFPMALITEQAGGLASTGMYKGSVQRVLEVMPESIHDRCPIIMGAPRDVNKVLELYKAK
uniref:Fructose-1,6-bisphosphatase, cytosolic n=1 Tax=Strombidinopsis acuminata TaxID=141414 RepID=A0A7S3W818_9SPIT|mmetsp:Transcript_18619/g.25732  ORF Transcript_18619/g.25732 Transcript_18619/m.25732 type:complete len:389 (+) Transcript_18619:67-1233(+)